LVSNGESETREVFGAAVSSRTSTQNQPEGVAPAGAGDANPFLLRAVGDRLFFFATRDSTRRLWTSDGTTVGTVQVESAALALALGRHGTTSTGIVVEVDVSK